MGYNWYYVSGKIVDHPVGIYPTIFFFFLLLASRYLLKINGDKRIKIPDRVYFGENTPQIVPGN